MSYMLTSHSLSRAAGGAGEAQAEEEDLKCNYCVKYQTLTIFIPRCCFMCATLYNHSVSHCEGRGWLLGPAFVPLPPHRFCHMN